MPRRGYPVGQRTPPPASPPRRRQPTERAFSISRKDGNDVRGPLDLASMKISRGKTKDTVAFTGRGPISNGDLDINDGNLLILIDTNDAPPFEYGQYVFFAGGKLRGVLVNLGTNNIVDRTVPTSRTGPRGFRQVIQRAKIHSPGTYRFIAGSYYQGVPMLGSTCVHRHDPQPIPSVDPARPSRAVVRTGTTGRPTRAMPQTNSRLRSSSTSPTTSSAPASRSGSCSGGSWGRTPGRRSMTARP